MKEITWLFDHSGTIDKDSMELFLDELNRLAQLPITSIVMDASDFMGFPEWNENMFVISTMQTNASASKLEHSVMVHQYDKYTITPEEIEYVDNLLAKYGVGSIDDFLKIHEAKLENSWHDVHARKVFLNRLNAYNMRKPKVCDCGAKHTSFPNHHYHWCEAKK